MSFSPTPTSSSAGRFFLPFVHTVLGAAVVFIFYFPSIVFSAPQKSSPRTETRIGVLAKRGPEYCLKQWSATADYLTEKIPDHTFKIVPLGFKEIGPAIEQHKVDFVLANSAIYVELEYIYGVNRIATMENLRQGKPYKVFGGVIFCKAESEDIKSIDDLRGRTFMAVEDNSFGGWLMARREMLAHGLDPQRDFKKFSFGGTHDSVVYSVLDGSVDAGTVRTDTLERMAAEGSINLSNFRVLDDHQHEMFEKFEFSDFPFLHSTRLYPEWPFAKVKGTPDHLAKQVAVALFNMPAESSAARRARIAGWTIPLNYQSVHECLKELQVDPYASPDRITFSRVIKEFFHWIVLVCLALFAMAAITAYVLRLNRNLYLSRNALAKARDEMEERVKKRTEELEKLNDNLRKEAVVRKLAETKALQAHQETNQILNTTTSGMVFIDTNYSVLKVNKAFADIMGVSKDEAVGKKCYEIFPGYRCDTAGCPLHQIMNGREMVELEDVKHNADCTEITCIINAGPFRNQNGEIIGIVESFLNISDRKRNEIALAEYTKELARSNDELQQFAYVASHDLQEPLRMVASYVQLLARRYKGKLDSDADEFIDFAVDGANRMKELIQDLLQYSRVNTKGNEFTPTDGEKVFNDTLANLQLAIEDSGADITHDPLPIVSADATQLRQLLQNLVGNAIKFHGDDLPRIHVSATLKDKEWLFSVRDNGIGIDPQYSDRIFEIFQRLHGKDEYMGTGIGLAVSKKIVERHGGKLWVESEIGKGSVFYFSIPEREEIAND